MGYIFLALTIAGFALQAFMQKYCTFKKGSPGIFSASLFIAGALYAGILIFLTGEALPTTRIILISCVGGIAGVLATVLMTRSLNYGHYGLSVAIISATFVLQVIVSFFLYGDKPQFFGIILVLVALFMMALSGGKDAKGQEAKSKFWKWLVMILTAFLINGAAATSQLLMSKEPGSHNFYYLMLFYGSGGILLLPVALRSGKPDGKSVAFGAIGAVGSFTGIFMTLKALEYLTGNVVFPVYFTGYMMAAALLSALFFKEKTGLLGYAGMAVGLSGIIVLCLK